VLKRVNLAFMGYVCRLQVKGAFGGPPVVEAWADIVRGLVRPEGIKL